MESDLKGEFPDLSRLDVHLEPLEPDQIPGSDVTGRRPDLARRVRALVEAHPQVLGCRDLETSSRAGHLVARVVG